MQVGADFWGSAARKIPLNPTIIIYLYVIMYNIVEREGWNKTITLVMRPLCTKLLSRQVKWSDFVHCLLIYPHLLVFIPFSNVTGTTDQKTIKSPNPFNPLTPPRKLFTALVHSQWQNCGGTHWLQAKLWQNLYKPMAFATFSPCRGPW